MRVAFDARSLLSCAEKKKSTMLASIWESSDGWCLHSAMPFAPYWTQLVTAVAHLSYLCCHLNPLQINTHMMRSGIIGNFGV